MIDSRTRQAIELMDRFAERTGERRRYLWTDAFAVTNYLGLARATGDPAFRRRALDLIDHVHQALGKHRPGGPRSGWLSGRAEPDARAHPAVAGLRIGKPLDELPLGAEDRNDGVEWDRDGQYFHYLTKWMHALDQTTRNSGDGTYTCWARELADAAHRAFVHTQPDGSKRMWWKMSVDLSRPVVPSMGQHDPLDGFVTSLQLQSTPAKHCEAPALDHAIRDFAGMIVPNRLATDDPLGIGGLLVDAHRLAQLGQANAVLEWALVAALAGVRHYATLLDMEAPATRRLAFRELGLAIGMAAVEYTAVDAGPQLRPVIDELEKFASLRNDLEAFWLRTEHRATELWREHADINDVMLATCLVPDGFLVLRSPPADVSFLNLGKGVRQASHSA